MYYPLLSSAYHYSIMHHLPRHVKPPLDPNCPWPALARGDRQKMRPFLGQFRLPAPTRKNRLAQKPDGDRDLRMEPSGFEPLTPCMPCRALIAPIDCAHEF